MKALRGNVFVFKVLLCSLLIDRPAQCPEAQMVIILLPCKELCAA